MRIYSNLGVPRPADPPRALRRVDSSNDLPDVRDLERDTGLDHDQVWIGLRALDSADPPHIEFDGGSSWLSRMIGRNAAGNLVGEISVDTAAPPAGVLRPRLPIGPSHELQVVESKIGPVTFSVAPGPDGDHCWIVRAPTGESTSCRPVSKPIEFDYGPHYDQEQTNFVVFVSGFVRPTCARPSFASRTANRSRSSSSPTATSSTSLRSATGVADIAQRCSSRVTMTGTF